MATFNDSALPYFFYGQTVFEQRLDGWADAMRFIPQNKPTFIRVFKGI